MSIIISHTTLIAGAEWLLAFLLGYLITSWVRS